MDEFFKTPIEYLKGVGAARAEALKKELGITSYGDLLQHFPFKYIDRTRFYKVKEVSPDLPYVQVLARLMHKEIVGEKAARRLVAVAQDETGPIELVWFQGITRIEQNLTVGKAYIFFGKPGFFNNKPQIAHPETELYSIKPAENKGSLALQPAYTSTEKLK
ncbi:MAG: ATP-dependent DNA helicase RecG, partial [Sphingobacteriaceae bacterium]